MPIPIILAGLAGLSGLVGAGAHMSAKETNEKAQTIFENAQRIYNNAKQSLEVEQAKTEKALLKLGYSKKDVLDTSIAQFLKAYERIKDVKLSESIGLNEIAKLTIDNQDTMELREMSNIYKSTFASGATGAAAGAVVALAASGSLPIVTGVLSTAGSAFVAGEVGMAAGLAGSALSFGAAMTPLAAIAAPAILFTGISSSIKADENLEKANTMYAEAELAVEKMKNSEILCNAISKKSDMFNNLLGELNTMFSECTALLDGVTTKKQGFFKNKTITEKDLSVEELNLIAVTRALAGAVKTVIDTPILDESGDISSSVTKVYNDTTKLLPAFAEQVKTIEQTQFIGKPITVRSNIQTVATSSGGTKTLRNIFALIVGLIVSLFARGIFIDPIVRVIVFSTVTLTIMDNSTKSPFFSLVKKCSCLALFISFTLLFYKICSSLLLVEHYVLKGIIISIVGFILFTVMLSSTGDALNSLKITLCRVCGCVCFAAIGILIYGFVARFLGLDFAVVKILITLLYCIFAWFSTCCVEN